MSFTPEFQGWVDGWKNDSDWNDLFHVTMTLQTNENVELKAHRDWVEEYQHGFGDRAFHYVWKMLIDQMPKTFNFLEIGVFKGQVLSLVAMLSRITKRAVRVHGITTLTNTRDERCQYPEGDYQGWINQIRKEFNESEAVWTLFVGSSRDQVVTNKARGISYDIVYVDGSHDYQEVIHDINTYSETVKLDGFLVMDDSSNFLNIGQCWPGLEDVSRAVRDVLEPDERFKHLFACGHLRVFQRIK